MTVATSTTNDKEAVRVDTNDELHFASGFVVFHYSPVGACTFLLFLAITTTSIISIYINAGLAIISTGLGSRGVSAVFPATEALQCHALLALSVRAAIDNRAVSLLMRHLHQISAKLVACCLVVADCASRNHWISSRIEPSNSADKVTARKGEKVFLGILT